MSGMIKRGPNKTTPWTFYGWPRVQRDWVGMRIKITRDMQNGFVSVKAGHKGEINSVTHKYAIRINLDGCGHCNVAPSFSRVSWRDLEIVND